MKSTGDGARGRPREVHGRLLEQAVALAEVARPARGDDVLPDRVAASRAWHDVVERQPRRAVAAVDAAPAVTGEQRPPRDAPLDRPRHADVRDEPDHVGPHVRVRRRPERLVETLDDLRLPLPHEYVGATCRAHVERLVARVQDENVVHERERSSGISPQDATTCAAQRPSDSYSGFGAQPRPEAMRFDMLKRPVTSATSITSSSLQPAASQRVHVRLGHLARSERELARVVERRPSIARLERRRRVVGRDRVGEPRILGQLPQRGAMGRDAVRTVVRDGDDHGDHLALRLRQAGVALHRLVVPGVPGEQA